MAKTVRADRKALHQKQPQLLEALEQKVVSHTQRNEPDWVVHTLMLEGCDSPFQFRRPRGYRSLVGARVNLSYYIETQELAGEAFQIMRVVRVRRS